MKRKRRYQWPEEDRALLEDWVCRYPTKSGFCYADVLDHHQNELLDLERRYGKIAVRAASHRAKTRLRKGRRGADIHPHGVPDGALTVQGHPQIMAAPSKSVRLLERIPVLIPNEQRELEGFFLPASTILELGKLIMLNQEQT